jgi:hypothetical protein
MQDAVEKDPPFPSLGLRTANALVDTPKLNGKKTQQIVTALIQRLFYSI